MPAQSAEDKIPDSGRSYVCWQPRKLDKLMGAFSGEKVMAVNFTYCVSASFSICSGNPDGYRRQLQYGLPFRLPDKKLRQLY